MSLKKRLATSLTALLLLFGGAIVVAPAASASIGATVTCSTGGVVGVYINKTAGTGASGWATISPIGASTVSYYYSNIASTASYYVSVGCGGSAGAWGTASYGPTVSGNWDFVCYPGYVSGGYNRCYVP